MSMTKKPSSSSLARLTKAKLIDHILEQYDHIDALEQESHDLSCLLDQTAEHSDSIEDQLLTDNDDLKLMIEATSEHSDAVQAELEAKKAEIRQAFGRYISDEVVATLLDSEDGLKLGGQRREITIFTSDLRGFTALSESLEPEVVVKVLNFYLQKMETIITHYNGVIDEFMGDGILVLFGAPVAREDDLERSVACAIDMQRSMTEVNEQMQKWHLPELEMGIGINTGEVVVGNIGSESRTKYAVVGSNVNLTYRIESYTLGGEILIADSSYQKISDILECKTVRNVSPKGVKGTIPIYSITGIYKHYQKFLDKSEAPEFEALPTAIPIRFSSLDGKHVSETLISANMIYRSGKHFVVAVSREISSVQENILPEANSNIKLLNMTSDQEAFAKVTENTSTTKLGENEFCCCFTSNNTIIKQILGF